MMACVALGRACEPAARVPTRGGWTMAKKSKKDKKGKKGKKK
jgi:hypothetical protein